MGRPDYFDTTQENPLEYPYGAWPQNFEFRVACKIKSSQFCGDVGGLCARFEDIELAATSLQYASIVPTARLVRLITESPESQSSYSLPNSFSATVIVLLRRHNCISLTHSSRSVMGEAPRHLLSFCSAYQFRLACTGVAINSWTRVWYSCLTSLSDVNIT